MISILVTGKIPTEALELLKSNSQFQVSYLPGLSSSELEVAIASAHGLIVRTETLVTEALLKKAPHLKVICRAGIGTDNIDVVACVGRGIVVMNTPAANRISTAEHTFGLILSLAKKIPQATALLKSGQWNQDKMIGVEISGKTLGIIGLGNIGQRVAPRAQAFGMKVIAADPYLDASIAKSLNIPLMPHEEVGGKADFVTLHVPLNDETTEMVDDEFLRNMKRGSFLINASRGKVVNSSALASALKSGHLGGAALDVFETEPLAKESPLLGLENIILTPHVAGKSKESVQAMGLMAAESISRFFERGIVENAVTKN